MNAVWTALLILDMPVAAPRPAPVVEVWVLLDSSERSAGLRHEIEWSRDPYHARNRYVRTDGIRWEVVEWESIPSFSVSVPSWKTRYSSWQPADGCGCGCGISRIAAALERDDNEYEQWQDYIQGGWWSGPGVSFEKWKSER